MLVERGGVEASLGPEHSAELLAYHDRMARDLRSEFAGRLVAQDQGFLLAFERPVAALRYSLAYHRGLGMLSYEAGVAVSARAGIHTVTDVHASVAAGHTLGNAAQDLTHRLCSLALAGQTLLTQEAFELARREAAKTAPNRRSLSWLAHGSYLFPGLEPLEVFEVGLEDLAPLSAPPDTPGAQRLLGEDDIPGWRPAPGQAIPLAPGWNLDHKLGIGGIGETWLARRETGNEARVFKFCYRTGRLRALQREIPWLGLLRDSLAIQPGICAPRSWNLEEAPYYFSSDYAQGESLADGLETRGGLNTLDLGARISLAARIADALAKAHGLGALHKGLHPGNVLFDSKDTQSWSLRLTDFGMGLMDERAGMGCPKRRLYLAPEVLAGQPPSIQADIFSLGVILFQLLTGDLTQAIGEAWESQISNPLLREDIGRAIHPDPRRRFDSAGALARRLCSLEQREERRRTEAAQQQQQRLNELLLDLFRPPEPEGTSLRFLLDRGREQLQHAVDDAPGMQAFLRESLAGAYARLELFAEAEQLLREALDLRQETEGTCHPRVGATLCRLAHMHLDQADRKGAEPLLQKAAEIFERHPESHGHELREGLELLASLYSGLGQHAQAKTLAARARGLRRA